MRSTRDVQKTTVEEICYKPREVKPWLVIFYLPSEPVWYIMLFVITYLAILQTFFSSVNNKCRVDLYNQMVIIADVVYAVDLILTGLVRFVKKLNVDNAEIVRRPLWIVICDVYSLMPQELLYSGDEAYFCLMRVNKTLRACRLVYMIHKSLNRLTRHVLMYIVDFSLFFTLCVFMSYCVYCNNICYTRSCNGTVCGLENMFAGIISSIHHMDEEGGLENKYFSQIINGLLLLAIIGNGCLFRALVTVHQIQRAEHQHMYMYRFKIMKHRQHVLNIPNYLRKNSIKNYKLYWHQTNGYSESKLSLAMFSSVMYSEILIDISWPAFKHSKLFRGMDLPFLRELSTYMKQISYLPNEIIYRKTQLKEKMIYIVSGTLSILSDEDGESPIMSFTTGTVIGELSLFVSPKSTGFLRCETFCKLHILEKKDFTKISLKYPSVYQALRSQVNDRLTYARESNRIVVKTQHLMGVRRNIDVYTTVWLKNILHALMSIDAETAYRHDFQNIHLMREVKYEKYILFCANNLDMLAIAERIGKSQDANFARLKFPYVLHSTSVLLKLWEVVIVSWTLVFSFVIPYMVFVSTYMPMWYQPLVIIGTLVFMVDIFVRISTTMETPSGILSTVTEITIQRFHTHGFWLDLISTIPFEVLNPVVLDELTPNTIAKMHVNRIFKIWRIQRLFNIWMNSSTVNHIFIIYLQFTWILSYVTFSLFMYLRYENPKGDLLHLIFISVQWATDLFYISEGFHKNNNVKAFVDEYVVLITLAFHASVAFIHVMQHLGLVKVQQVGFDLLSLIKKKNLKSYSNRVVDFLLIQWQDNYCYYLHKDYLKQVYLSAATLSETANIVYGDEVSTKIPLFQCFGDVCNIALCTMMTVMLFAPQEVIALHGYSSGFAYIMFRGTCEVLDGNGISLRTIDVVEACNLIEVLLQTPNVYTYRAVTHCMVLRITRQKLLGKLFHFETEFKFLKQFLTSSADIKTLLMGIGTSMTSKPLAIRYQKKKNFVSFVLADLMDSFEEYDYHIPFDRLYPFGFIKYFFLRHTIMPDGSFLYGWQVIRSCLVLITGICYFVPIIIVDCPWILHALDVFGLIDIYFRLHVCFYNPNGILVTHPLETSRYYWQNAFLTDFFSVIPLRYIFSHNYDWTLIVLNSNHLLQLNSYFQMMHYVKADILKPRSKWINLFYIPFILILCNFLGVVLFTLECEIRSNSSENTSIYIGYKCVPNSVLASSPFSKPISLVRAHLYYVYISTSLITKTAFRGPIIHHKVTKVMFMIGLSIGLYVSVKFVGKMQELHCFRQGALLESQIAMRNLKTFLHVTVRDSKLKQVVIRTCELKWLRLRGQGVFQVVEPFTLALRADILYEFYGKNLVRNSPFKDNIYMFYKNILPLLKFDLILKGGYMQTINDIDNNIYILYQGMADVLAPDGTTLQTLQAGSIYGNIMDRERSRLKLSIVAMTHVEVLMIDAITFLNYLRYHPRAHQQYQELRARYIYYIPTKPGIVRLTEETTSKKKKTYMSRALEPNSHFVRIWTALHLSFSCYLGVLIDIYQMGSADYSYTLITIQYFADLIYLANFLLQDRIAYENEWGYMVYDLRQIKKHNRKEKGMLVITIISMIPTDVLIYTMSFAMFRKTGFNALYRINRFLRIAYILQFIKIQARKLDVSIFWMKLLNLAVMYFLIINIFASVLACVCSSLTPNLLPEIPDWNARSTWNSSSIFKLHLTFFTTTWNAFSLSEHTLYVPQGALHIALFILTIICGYYCYITASCELFSIIHDYYIQKGQYLKLFNHIKYFLLTENVSASLKGKCLTIFSALWTNYGGEVFPQLLDEVSPYLRDAVMNCAFTFFVGSHSVFEQCHTDFVRQVVQKVRYRIYFPGEYVQFKGSIDRTMYFVFDGEVHAVVDEYLNNDEIVEILTKGDSFGIKQGLDSMKPHTYSYRCKTKCTILSLYLFDWEYLLTYFPASKELLRRRMRQYYW